jgi:hypothetical protein
MRSVGASAPALDSPAWASTDGTRVTRDKRALTVFIDHKNPSIIGKQKGAYSWKSAVEEIL